MSVQPKIQGQEELLPSGEPRNILDLSIADLTDIDPERRITLATLCRSLGSLVLDYEVESKPSDNQTTNLTATRFINQGLYIYLDDSRYQTAQQLIKTRSMRGLQQADDAHLKLPFNLGISQPGIVFPASEYGQVARSPADLVRATMAKTRNANKDNPDQQEIERKVRSSAAKTLREYMQKLRGLEAEYIAERAVFTRVLKQTRGFTPRTRTPQNQFRAKNLDRDRKLVDEILYETLETAAINNYLGPADKKRQQREIREELYGNRSARQIDRAWNSRTTMLGLYTNAKRFKVIQSLAACQSQFVIFRGSIRTEGESQQVA